MNSPLSTAGEAKCCSACGAPFRCGARAATCWCQSVPALPREDLDSTADCLCESCLAARVQQAPRQTDNC